MREKWIQALKWIAYVVLAWLVLWSVTQQLKIPDPISWSWYPMIKDLQTGIGAALGLIAILGGAFFNAHLNRRRDERIRDNDSRSLAASLAGEIEAIVKHEKQLLDAMDHEIHSKQTNDVFFNRVRQMFAVPRDTKIYDSSLNKTGFLAPELVLDTIDFYAFFERANKAAPLVVDPQLTHNDRIDQILEVFEKISARVTEGEQLAERLRKYAGCDAA